MPGAPQPSPPLARVLSFQDPPDLGDYDSRGRTIRGRTTVVGTCSACVTPRSGYVGPVVPPHVSHFMQVPFRTSLESPNSLHNSL
jgi:hypothetical protein